MDIPLDDPEANKAAAKIQAGFRGHMTRKKMKPGEKTGDEVSSSGEALNGSEGDTGQFMVNHSEYKNCIVHRCCQLFISNTSGNTLKNLHRCRQTWL